MRLIDADVFAKKAYDVAYPVVHGRDDHERGLTLSGIAELLDEIPTVYAVPVRHGKWLPREEGVLYPFWERYTCSECGKHSDDTCYCPNCGADMRGADNDTVD